jgi:hypothetical protein
MRNVDPVLSNKLNSQYQTKANNAQPKMNVAIARARNTVSDSSYWVVETIRQKSGLGDVSVAPRRQKVTGPPNRIYEIHVNDGVVGTSIREYPDKFKDGWVDQFDVGPGSSVAIAFDGEWERYRNLWRLVTHEKPWIFWVDNTGVLWAQLWDDTGTKQQLATGVVYCRAIRAWKNLNMADHDQGIVVGYIKTDGKVYYRNYCQRQDLSYVWETERQVIEFTGTALSLNLFITNDYRMGFVVEDSLNDIYWYITDRNWAGMAIAAESVTVAPAELKVELIPIDYIGAYTQETISAAPAELGVTLLYADTDNDFMAMNAPKTMLDEFDEPYDDWGWIIDLTIDHPIPSLTLANVTATNLDNSTVIQMSSIERVDDFNYRLHVSDVVESGLNNVYGDIQVDITGAINPAGYTYINMTHTFTPINLIPTFIPLPEVEVIFNE